MQPPVWISRETEDTSPSPLQRPLATLVDVFTRGYPGGERVPLHQVSIQRESQPAVYDHRLWIHSLYQAHGEAWIVSQHGANTHQNGIVSGPQLVGKCQGLWAAQGQRLTWTSGDTAIQALRVA